jgi:hypothetical protein
MEVTKLRSLKEVMRDKDCSRVAGDRPCYTCRHSGPPTQSSRGCEYKGGRDTGGLRRAAMRLIIDTSRLADPGGSPEGPVRRAVTNHRQGIRPQPVDRGYRTAPRGATSTAETPRA